MARSRLRIYYGPEDNCGPSILTQSQPAPDTVTVPLEEILSFLADAVRTDRAWLNDFRDDEVTISTDLYEVILADQHYRRPSA